MKTSRTNYYFGYLLATFFFFFAIKVSSAELELDQAEVTSEWERQACSAAIPNKPVSGHFNGQVFTLESAWIKKYPNQALYTVVLKGKELADGSTPRVDLGFPVGKLPENQTLPFPNVSKVDRAHGLSTVNYNGTGLNGWHHPVGRITFMKRGSNNLLGGYLMLRLDASGAKVNIKPSELSGYFYAEIR